MTRTITLSDDHWQKISDALSDCYDEGPPDSPWKSPGLEAAQAALDDALSPPAPGDSDNRDPECVQQWPECEDGAYDPRCCRFPKGCSCGPRITSVAPPAPEPGEVAELVDRLGWIAAQLGDIGWSDDSASVARAATLLQQLSTITTEDLKND